MFLTNVPGARFIQGCMFIPESRVSKLGLGTYTESSCLMRLLVLEKIRISQIHISQIFALFEHFLLFYFISAICLAIFAQNIALVKKIAKHSHKANLWIFLKNRSNEISSNEIRIRRELPVASILLYS